MLLYTDGLVERRDGDIDDSLEWLRTTVAVLAESAADRQIDPERLCDALLDTPFGVTTRTTSSS